MHKKTNEQKMKM